MPVAVEPVEGRADLRRFVDLPWKVYAGDAHWVPPLRIDVERLLTPGKHPFHEHAQVQPMLARRQGRVVGRVVAHVNHAHNRFHEDDIGFFGLFEALDAEAAQALFEAAFAWLRARGRSAARGPMDLSTNEVCGLLISGEPGPPVVMMPYNPLHYAQWYEAAGLRKVKDLVAYFHQVQAPPERLARGAALMERRHGVRTRKLDMTRFDAEVERVLDLYNRCWERNWGFVPMSDAEVRFMAKELRHAIDPHIVQFLEREGDGRPLGFGLALPDMNLAVRHANGRLLPLGLLKILWHRRHIHRCRVLTLGIVPEARGKGLYAVLLARMLEAGFARGYREGEYSWMLEDNQAIRVPIERLGAHVWRTYRVYERPL
jgi:GNAT superfamily N-acetyltransferase